MQLEGTKSTIIKDTKRSTVFFKGVAILLVILVHAHQRFDLSNAQNAIQRFGQMGCQIFFVLSSFGLCHSFAKETPGWFSFMKKRVSKLAIGYWCAIGLFAIYRVIMALIAHDDVLDALNIPGIIINMLFLNGFVPVGGINNSIVRGGWYVGTTVILYGLFPLLYKLYFADKKQWVKNRLLLFPTTVFIASAAAVVAAGFVHPGLACTNNSFVYFSFVNQLTPFCLGIVLYDLVCHRNQAKLAPYGALVLFVISVILFYGEYKYSFVFCPTFVAASFMLLYWHLINSEKFNSVVHGSNKIVKTICSFGKLSFSIYLTHSFIAYDLSANCLKILSGIYKNDLLWHLILLPIVFGLTYLVGYAFHKCIAYIKKDPQ